MLYTLMYSSVAAFAVSDDEVATMLNRSRERNATDGITGVLVHLRFDGNRSAFLQVLEGPRLAVEMTYGRIEHDELHEDLTVLLRSPIEMARYQQWSMKFATLDEAGLRTVGASLPGEDPVLVLQDRAAMDRVVTALGPGHGGQ